MKNIRRLFLFVMVSLFSFIIYNQKVFSLEIIDLGSSSYYQSSTSSNSKNLPYCKNKACFSGRASGARITLVDDSGNKVSGTRSVDIMDSTEKGKTVYSFSIADGGYIYTSNERLVKNANLKDKGLNVRLINNSYKYKYGVNEQDDFIILGIPNGPNYVSDPTLSKFSSRLVNGKKEYEYLGDDVSLLEFLVRYMNYIDDSEFLIGSKKTNLNNYYLIFEPTFFVRYCTIASENCTPDNAVYGTSTEIAEILYGSSAKKGAYYGFGSRFYTFACAAYNPSINENFISGGVPRVKNESYSWQLLCPQTKSSPSWSSSKGKAIIGDKLKKMANDYFLNSDYGLGIRVFDINVPCEGDTCDPTSGDVVFDLDLCKSGKLGEEYYEADGILSFTTHEYTDVPLEKLSTDPVFEVEGDTESNSYVACYDNVQYDFSEAIGALRSVHKVISTTDIPDGKGHIERTCWVQDQYNFLKDRGKYSNICYFLYGNSDVCSDVVFSDSSDVPFRIEWGDDHEGSGLKTYGANIYTLNEESLGTFTNSKGQSGKVVRYTLDIHYTLNESIDISSSIEKLESKAQKGKYNLNVENETFGLGNKFVKECDSYGVCSKINYLDGNVFSGSGNNRKCIFYPEISNENTDVVFRTISLENPFPARDGGSRIPGINWLNDDNNVFQYITNNRGIRYAENSDDVSPDAIYSSGEIEPMYTVTLDTETMIKIRNYNKENSGYVMPSVKCDSEGKQCYSGFLREVLGENLDGVCVLEKSTDEEKIKSILWKEGPKIEMTVEELSLLTAGFKNRGLDLNKNNVNDSEDIEIINNYNLNTPFYTCANKTYKSGGPVSYSEGGSD